MKNENGFTLIEVLIAVVLLAIISLLVWQSMGSSIGSKDRSEKREGTYRAATLTMDRMTRDLSMAVLFSNLDFLGVSPNGEQMTKSVFIGTNSGDQDQLTFDTLSHVRYIKDVKESDLSEVTYFLEKDTESEQPGLYLLKKREKSPPDANPAEGGTAMTLLEGVKELNFRYYDPAKTEFKDEWDSTKLDNLNKLPRAVEITLVVQDPNDEEASLRFATLALLEMSPGPNDF